MNLTRVRLQRAIDVARGLDVASGTDPLGREWFDADCPLPEQIARLEHEANALRLMARIKARKGWGA